MTPRPPAPRPRPGRARSAAAAVLALSLALSGCAQVPQSSAVRSGAPLDTGGGPENVPQFHPPGPAEGATAEQLLRGFVLAGTAPEDGYAIARQHLAGEAVDRWDPSRTTVVYTGEPTVVQGQTEGAWELQLEVAAEVDEYGLRTDAPPNTTRAWDVTVEEVGGQLRITSLPDGTLLSTTRFAQLFAPQALYFHDQTGAYAVPDIRWFVNRRGTVTSLARALLRGPAPYLTGAVTTAFPLRTGADLTSPSVPVSEDGVASVDLTPATVEGTDTEQLFRMQEQMELTLTGITGVERVAVTVDGRPLLPAAGDARPLPAETKASAGTVQVGVDPETRELVLFQGLAVSPVGGVPDVSDLAPVDPAMDRERTRFAFLDPSRTALRVATADGTRATVLQGSALTAPSLDTHGWTWTVDRGAGSIVDAVPADGSGPRRVVTTPWLQEGESIVDLKVGFSGTRAALVVDDGRGERSLRVSGIVRGDDAVPTALTEPVRVPTQAPPDQVGWVGEDAMVVARVAADAEERVRPEIVSLDGTSRVLNPLAGLQGISSGDVGTLYAETEEDVFLLVGSSWRAQELETPVRDLSFPG
ncbi:LpqB family beta-propeller domain-containing protein [Micrococcus sp.]|uniref:LpqB family beta-propeller domain-containing protein n=1 Tax=Micrococcus sp. TaxID=1271 RepID=UPI0026DD19C0|nr:LpqB family beta-propeller domain-containing protein [Micrococcus sp.]MDO4239972.1 LpqB family beta-propeller domain-containing protein [Micrococcus sp.]